MRRLYFVFLNPLKQLNSLPEGAEQNLD